MTEIDHAKGITEMPASPPTPVSEAERKRTERTRKRKAGLAPLEIWARPEHHAEIKAFVAKLSGKGVAT